MAVQVAAGRSAPIAPIADSFRAVCAWAGPVLSNQVRLDPPKLKRRSSRASHAFTSICDAALPVGAEELLRRIEAKAASET